MRPYPMLFAATAAIFTAMPAQSAVFGFDDVALGLTPTEFVVDSYASFDFAYDAAAAAAFDPDTYSVRTNGTGETSAFGGFLGIPLEPSSFDQSGITIDGNLFPSYAAFPTLTAIPFSLVASDLALRYARGSDFYYGYARLNGNGTIDVAFESQANTAITAGAAITGAISPVPEPATWAMMIGGFGMVGGAMRRRKAQVRVTYA